MADIPIMIDEIDEAIPASSTYRLDLEQGIIAGRVDGLEAVRQYIRKALITPRFKCLIYDGQYGSETQRCLLDVSVSEAYVRSEIPRLVEESLLYDDRILNVSGFSFEVINKEMLHVIFTVNSIYGVIGVDEVVV